MVATLKQPEYRVEIVSGGGKVEFTPEVWRRLKEYLEIYLEGVRLDVSDQKSEYFGKKFDVTTLDETLGLSSVEKYSISLKNLKSEHTYRNVVD
jgi:hypothetical protein